MNRIFQVLFWSVIAAAFVGPGTVTTCAKAGAGHGFALLWAVGFSAIACLTLQEAAARITAVSGRNLGQALRDRFRGRLSGLVLLILVLGAIVVGCAAYQAGNILGAVAGFSLALALPREGTIAALCIVAGLLLWFARTRTVANAMGLVVALMGISFVVTALLLKPPLYPVLRGALIPQVPDGAGLLVVGVIGTTVVPYNLFLGSGLARGQKLGEIRFGLSVAVLLGGLISMGILVVGQAVSGPFSFEALSVTLSGRLGGFGSAMFAIGLFAAGFTSAITAPLAAAITARSLFEGQDPDRWSERSWRYRTVWIVVMLTGAGFALAAVRPVHVIVLAQALNGILLPFVAVFLLLVVNDRQVMTSERLNRWPGNLLMGVVVLVALVLGLSSLRAAVLAAING